MCCTDLGKRKGCAVQILFKGNKLGLISSDVDCVVKTGRITPMGGEIQRHGDKSTGGGGKE